MSTATLWFDTFNTPIGMLTVAADAQGLRHLLFPENRHETKGREHWQRDAAPVAEARRQLLEYFDGQRTVFDLPLAPAGTEFQVQVWQTLAEIPFGGIWSYAELARRVNRPKAVRAVGEANGRNPLPIILPCHRVIGADGSLTGFGGGLPAKAALLRLEKAPVLAAMRQEGDLFA